LFIHVLCSSSLVCSIRLQLGVTRVLGELILVDLGELRAAKLLSSVTKSRADLVDCSTKVGDEAGEDVRKSLDGELQAVAHKVVALKQGLSVEDTIGQKLGVDADEAVGCTSVTTNAGKLKMLEQLESGVLVKEQNIIRVKLVASVPVLRDALVTRSVFEVAIITSNGEERFEYLAVELAGRVLSRLVAHETIDEGPRCRLSHHTREGSVEEVGVVIDVLLEACSSSVGQQLKIVVVVCLASVVQSLEVLHLQQVVLTVKVQITSRWRCVTLVLVVGAADALGLAKKVDGRYIWCGTTDTPGHKVAVDCSSVDSKDGRKINSHTKYLSGGCDELVDGADTVVRQVAVVAVEVSYRQSLASDGETLRHSI